MNFIDIEHLVTALRQLSFASSAFSSDATKMDVELIKVVCEAVAKCISPFHNMGLKTSAGMMAKFIVAAHRNQDVGEWTGIRFATECNGVFNAVQCETIGLLCFKLDANHAGYLDKAFPFGKRVSVAFPECSEDIFEAHQCMAFERYTAAMFHIGRAMETTVRKVAKKMGTKTSRDEWQYYLNAMNDKIKAMSFKTPAQKKKRQPWSETAAYLFNFKEAWRNPTFHAKKTYTAAEAVAVLSNAGQFMDCVAKNIFKIQEP